MRTGILVGSFDPYTIGHDSLVKRALPLFDKIVIGVGYNERKKYMQTTETRVETIRQIYRRLRPPRGSGVHHKGSEKREGLRI